MQISVAIIEDQRILRETLAESLSTCDEFKIAGCWATAEDAMAHLEKEPFDVALIDLFLPGMDAISASQKFKQKYPNLKTIIMTMFLDQVDIFQAVKAGVTGILHKNISIKELVDAILCVQNGETVFDQTVIKNFLKSASMPKRIPSKDILTTEEIRMLRLTACGLSNKKIADELALSLPSIKLRFREIFQKLDARDRTHAVAKAFHYGILAFNDGSDLDENYCNNQDSNIE